ncbi:MAG: GTP cyclohydrolase I FolE [Minisyncoccia bacterium]
MSFDKTKVDPVLGKKVREYLIKMGVETPINNEALAVENKKKIDILENAFTTIWKTVGMDLNDDSLQETPNRMAKMYINEIYFGLKEENFPKCTTVNNKMQYNEMVVERNVSVQSNCEHPKDRVLGLSKINRIVEYFSKRPQIQERLTEQIFHTLQYILDTEDVAVMIDAQHYCVKSRGVEDTGSSTVTSRLGGGFKSDPAVRNEFYSIARSGCK